jgi:tRNA1Val (adenine37-N6)-methyltransferase
MVNKSGYQNVESKKAISRHEIMCKLDDVIKASCKLLKTKGRLYIVHRSERLIDLVYLMRQYKIEPKKLRFVYPYKGKASNLILIEGIKDGKPNLKLINPLYIYDEDGKYSEEIDKIYGRSKNA